MPAHANFAQIILSSGVAARPALIEAATSDGGPRVLTYKALRANVDAFASQLVARGLRPGGRIAISADNCLEFVIAFLAIMKVGLVAVPFNTKLPAATTGTLLDLLQPDMAFVEGKQRGFTNGRCDEIDFTGMADCAAMEEPADQWLLSPPPDEVAFIVFTSGSTGVPKAVPLTHRGYIWATEVDLSRQAAMAQAKALVAAPFYHLNGIINTVRFLRVGGTVVLLKAFSAQSYVEAAKAYACEYITGVPTMLALAVQELALRHEKMEFVNFVSIGSAPSSAKLIADIRGAFPNAAVVNTYGTSEAGPKIFGAAPGGAETPPSSVGCPVAGVDIRLRGPGAPEEGLLFIRTPAMTPGYIGLPEENRQKFEDGWYVSGDIMRKDENNFYYFVGRDDDLMICGGINLYPSEVEKLLERHPAVAQAAVIAQPDELKGEIPMAFVVRKPKADVTAADLKAFALQHGPAYAHPRHIVFVPALPLASTNKVDRQMLARWATEKFAEESRRREDAPSHD